RASSASCSTRRLNESQVNSRLRYHSLSVRSNPAVAALSSTGTGIGAAPALPLSSPFDLAFVLAFGLDVGLAFGGIGLRCSSDVSHSCALFPDIFFCSVVELTKILHNRKSDLLEYRSDSFVV